jgi:flagellar biosynthetic protein FlhB
MAEDDKDQDQKTEEPSQRRLEQSREKGQTFISKEVMNWFFMGSCAVVLIWVLPFTASGMMNVLTPFLAAPDQMILAPDGLHRLSRHMFTQIAPKVALPLLVLFIVIIIISVLQVGSSISLKSLTPKMSRISIKQGLKKIFSKNAVMEFLKTVLKAIILIVSLYFLFKNHVFEIKTWTHLTLRQTLNVGDKLIFKLFLTILIILFFLAALDYIYQRYEFMKNLRMTKQEVKEEHKESDGDPAIKQRIRQLRMERSRNRMMQNIPTATVVITNPTHYSVALTYDHETMDAPRVVAKGQDHLALLIRERAKQFDIPIIENAPIARSLYSRVDLDKEIPEDTYRAVADIIRFVQELKNQRF